MDKYILEQALGALDALDLAEKPRVRTRVRQYGPLYSTAWHHGRGRDGQWDETRGHVVYPCERAELADAPDDVLIAWLANGRRTDLLGTLGRYWERVE